MFSTLPVHRMRTSKYVSNSANSTRDGCLRGSLINLLGNYVPEENPDSLKSTERQVSFVYYYVLGSS